MLSVMTVVLPQHSSATISRTNKAEQAEVADSETLAVTTKTAARCKNCECLCKTENMTKNNLPQRCPFLKGYMVEPRRHHHMDVHGHRLHHPHQGSPRERESLREAACYWKDKYDRLYESQRRLQKVNEGLEEKLLKVAEKFENEKSDLTRDVTDLTTRLVEARLTIAELEEENEQYKNDCSIAVRLLQCKPSNFVAHKFNTLPADFQTKVKKHLVRNAHRLSNNSTSAPSCSLLYQCPPDVRTIKVSVPTLPQAAMVYAVSDTERSSTTNSKSAPAHNTSSSESAESTPDHVSAAIIAKVLEERCRERRVSVTYSRVRSDRQEYQVTDSATQTVNDNYNLCPRCSLHFDQSNSSSEAGKANTVICQMPSSSSTETAI